MYVESSVSKWKTLPLGVAWTVALVCYRPWHDNTSSN
jgi:hypothetical protein